MFVILECIYIGGNILQSSNVIEMHTLVSSTARYSCVELEGFELYFTIYSYCICANVWRSIYVCLTFFMQRLYIDKWSTLVSVMFFTLTNKSPLIDICSFFLPLGLTGHVQRLVE